MQSKVISLKVAGVEQPDKIDLNVFSDQIKHFTKLLNEIKKDRNLDVTFVTGDISHNSPYNIGIEIQGEDCSKMMSVMNEKNGSLQSIIQNDTHTQGNLGLSPQLLDSYKKLLTPLHKGQLSSISIVTDTDGAMDASGIIEFDDADYNAIDEYIQKTPQKIDEEDNTELFGRLKVIDLHKEKKFAIYDNLDNKINCLISDDAILDKVKGLIDCYVDITGKAYYKPNAHIPFKVEVHSIEEYKRSSADYMTLEDLYGTGKEYFRKDKSAVELIREIRDK